MGSAEYSELPNLLRVSARIYSGAEPSQRASFQQLVRLGVRTVVSVDGVTPDLVSARRHGLRYIHIPIGYDGVNADARRQLAHLVRAVEGPYYVHCHHGKHRGPAAAAIAALAAGEIDNKAALEILARAGTNKKYTGLFRDVRQYSHLKPADGEPPELLAVSPVSVVASNMARLDRAFDRLRLVPQHARKADDSFERRLSDAVVVREAFREMRRAMPRNDYDAGFTALLNEAEEAAAKLEQALVASESSAARPFISVLQKHCAECHDRYRD